MTPIPRISAAALLERYDVFFLDAYGVLVTTGSAIEGAVTFLERLRESGKRHAILSNDASRLPGVIAKRHASLGLPVTEAHVFAAGMLLQDYFATHALGGARCVVLGTPDSHAYVTQAGGEVVPMESPEFDVLVVADDDGFPFLQGVETVLTAVFRLVDAGRGPRLVLPNPDLIYPKGADAYGLTSGSIALILEHALALRYPGRGVRFDRLGKPGSGLFALAARTLGIRSDDATVMVGDQLHTDIAGARNYGIDSVLVGSGLTRLESIHEGLSVERPTYWMPSVAD